MKRNLSSSKGAVTFVPPDYEEPDNLSHIYEEVDNVSPGPTEAADQSETANQLPAATASTSRGSNISPVYVTNVTVDEEEFENEESYL